MKKKSFILAVLAIFTAGCVATEYSRADRAIEAGIKWGSVGAATGALVGVAANTNIGRAAALGALAAGIPAIAVEATKTPTDTTLPPSPLHLPGPKELRISGYLDEEVRWAAIKEVRNLGYQVIDDYSAPLELQLEQKEEYGRYIVLSYLIDRSGRIIAQGRGEVSLFLINEKSEMMAKIKATILAIRNLE